MGESEADVRHMRTALDEAARAVPHSAPNPAVGCAIVTRSGQVAVGHTQPPGAAHAEVQALREAQRMGLDVRGATVYVTLEPCSHFGRTPPCADALVAAGVSRVVIAGIDPNPLVAGKGAERLRQAGINVLVGVLEDEARELNLGFLSRMQHGRPWVRAKVAASVDGRTALPNGASQWITGPEARRDGHAWRARADIVMTGVGTILQDDPRLDAREVDVTRQPARLVVDSHLRTPASARIFTTASPVIICTAHASPSDAAVGKALANRGAKIESFPSAGGQVDLQRVMQHLGQRGINEVHLEAGATLTGAMAQAGLVDEWLIYLAPRLMGTGRGMIDIPLIESLDRAMALRFVDVTQVGEDLRIRARPASRR